MFFPVRKCITSGLAAALALGAWGAAPAQKPFVPVESYDRTRPDFGNRLPLCVFPNSATLERDREVAAEIAQLLLLEPDIVEMDINFDTLDAGGVWPSVFLYLAERCVGVMGVQLIPGTQMPDWLTITRPYFQAPYLLVDLSGEATSLYDLPADARLGVPIRTPVDLEVLQLIAAGGAFADFQRRPYDRLEVLDLLIASGALDAAIIWKPHLQSEAFSQYADSAVPAVPLKETKRSLGIVLRSQDEMLRTMIDDAIAALGGRP